MKKYTTTQIIKLLNINYQAFYRIIQILDIYPIINGVNKSGVEYNLYAEDDVKNIINWVKKATDDGILITGSFKEEEGW